MSRRVMLVVVAAALVASACSEAFEGPPDGSPGAGATIHPTQVAGETPAASPTPASSPVTVALGELPSEGDRLVPVRVLGWIETGGSVLCGGGTCLIDLVDPRDPRTDVNLELATDASGVPNTMPPLGSGYREADLRVTTDDGATLYAGDFAWVTGMWNPGRSTLTADVVMRGSAPKQTAVTSSIAQLRSRKPGTLVKVTGRLDTPFLLSCAGGTCNLYLEDVKNASRSVRIEVRLGPSKGSRPNTMRPLGDNFRASQLRVFDLKTRVCRAGERVNIVGWVYRNDDGTPYIDPVMTITRVGK
jgi:hypothetical protein